MRHRAVRQLCQGQRVGGQGIRTPDWAASALGTRGSLNRIHETFREPHIVLLFLYFKVRREKNKSNDNE